MSKFNPEAFVITEDMVVLAAAKEVYKGRKPVYAIDWSKAPLPAPLMTPLDHADVHKMRLDCSRVYFTHNHPDKLFVEV
jgi:hypothetical protein